ncbi:MAG TPA: CpsD/CapB family tyrosine-protein kinase [Myxococcota bacterium]|nr:CpsD/CapB family tyrosine-protein kinase [Myxococcota bacterium]
MGKIHDALQRAEALRQRSDEPARATDITAADLAPRIEVPARGWRDRFRRNKAKTRKKAVTPVPAGKVLVSDSGSPYSEEYRTLRARIHSLRRTRELRSIVLSSARPNEGKTTTAVNLALSFGAERENSVCLVDADLRTPRVHRAFAGTGVVGLAEVLEGDAKLEEALVLVPDSRLMVLPVKAMPTAPSELLSSRAMRELVAELHTRFHTVIFDAPPVLGLPDTVTLVDLCDSALFVVGAGRSPRDEVESALERLDANKVIGVVLNRCAKHEVGYLGAYGYGKS